jgi:hypothetical protein
MRAAANISIICSSPNSFNRRRDEKQHRAEELKHPENAIPGCFQAGRIRIHETR